MHASKNLTIETPSAGQLWAREMLLLGSRTALDERQTSALIQLCHDGAADEAAWDELLDLAARHGVRALLFWSLKTVDWTGVPSWVSDDLKQFFHFNAAHSFALTRELLRINELLKQNGVEMVSFKGATLASAVYGNVALRQFSDLDLLVSREQVLQARQILLDDAYRLRVPLSAAQEAAFLREDSVFDLVRETPQILIELHWGLTSRCFARPMTFETVRPGLQTIEMLGAPVAHLAHEELLLLLCIHGTKHLWERLQWVADVNELLQRHGDDLNWERVFALAQDFRVERMLLLGLGVTQSVLGTTLPQTITAKIEAAPAVRALMQIVRARLFTATPLSTLENSRFLLRCMTSWSDRARFAAHVAFAPSAEERVQKRSLSPLGRIRWPGQRESH